MQVQIQDTKKITKKSVGLFFRDNIIIVGIVVLAIVVGFLKENFFGVANIRNLLSNTAVRFIIAVGVSGCLITKGTDLSAGRIVGFAACLSAIFLQRNDYSQKFYPDMQMPPVLWVLLGVLLVCGFIGSINGAVIAFFKVPPFIATLGMQTLVYGICLVYTGAKPIGGLHGDFTSLSTGAVPINIGLIAFGVITAGLLAWVIFKRKKLGEKSIYYLIGVFAFGGLAYLAAVNLGPAIFSYVFLTAVGVGILMWFLYNKTRHGKYMYAIGGNENAAEVAGVNCRKSKVLIYMLAGMLYGLCGFLIASRSGSGSVNTAQGYELEAIAGCTIGGVSVNGGVGKISGILIGVLVFEILKVAMQFMGIKSDYTYIVQGLVIIIAVALDLRKYLAKK